MNAFDDNSLAEIARELARSLTAAGATLAAAESCTGGWIAKCCTDLAGSSAWFERGFVTYSNEAKMAMLGVDQDTLASDGAVSEIVAIQMAEGACSRAGTDAALAVTGVAGPGGGTAEKPVGTVWFAWACAGRGVRSAVMHFSGDRQAVRRQSVAYALKGMLISVDEAAPGSRVDRP
jgi:nicotinamide-nucleotide amidase